MGYLEFNPEKSIINIYKVYSTQVLVMKFRESTSDELQQRRASIRFA